MAVKLNMLSRLPPLPTIKDILRIYRLRAMKQLSQNFILDPAVSYKVVKCAGDLRDSHVCEIGPGPGNLTRPILEAGVKEVVVIEKDKRFIPSLELLADASQGRLRIIIGDCLEENLENIFPREISQPWESEKVPFHIIGNLPFNISTALIIRLLRQMSKQQGPFVYGRVNLTLTFQKEVADRIAATIMTEERNRLSVMCQNLCHVERRKTIPGSAFMPKPKVDVGVVKFIPRVEPLIKLPFELVERVVRCVFHFRQKYCKNGVQLLFPKERTDLTLDMLKRAEIKPNVRPYELEVDEVGRLCIAYEQMIMEMPEFKSFDYSSPNL